MNPSYTIIDKGVQLCVLIISFFLHACDLIIISQCTMPYMHTVTAQAFDCGGVCFSEYLTSFSPDCDLLTYVLQCYNEHIEDCENDDLASFSIDTARNDFDILGCPPLPTPSQPATTTEPAATTTIPTVVPMTTEPPAVSTCPIMVPPYVPGMSAPELTPADVSPAISNPACVVQEGPLELQHCSLFGFSNLRPFQLYSSGLGACNIPGSWFLLKHPAVTVEVEGVVSGEECDHSRLSKVSIQRKSTVQLLI